LNKIILVLVFLIGLLPAGNAQADKKVYWGGVGFVSWEDRKERYPYSSQLLCRKGNCPSGNIDLMARKFFENKTFKNFKFSNETISSQEIEGIIMAPMIVRETIDIGEDITEGKTSFIHTYRIFANLMFFEFGTGRFIAAQPVVIQYLDVFDHPATKEKNSQIISDLLGNETRKVNVFKSLYEKSQNINPHIFAEKFVQITDVKLGDSVKNIIAKKFKPGPWKTQIGQIFEANLIAQTGAPLIPSMDQERLQGELMTTFRDASFKIVLPDEPAYRISLDINKFKLFEKLSPPSKTVCYAVSINLKIESLLGEILNLPFRRTQSSCSVVAASKILDPTFYFPGSLLSLLNQVSKQFGANPDKGFLKEASPKDSKALKKIKNAKKEVFKIGL